MNGLELPRISGFLRSLDPKSRGVFDPQQEELKRQQLIAKKRAAKRIETPLSSSSSQKTGSNDSETKSLSWKYFADATNVSSTTEKERRSVYTQFLQNVVSLAGDDTPPDELHLAAYYAFEMLCDPGRDDLAKKEALLGLFGPVQTATYNQMLSQVNKLSQWRNPYTEKTATPSNNNSDANSKSNKEFSSDIKLSFERDELEITINTNTQRIENNKTESQSQSQPQTQQQNSNQQPQSSKKDNKKSNYSEEDSLSEYWNKQSSQPIDATWLPSQCSTLISLTGIDYRAEELADSIFTIIKADKEQSVLQSELYDLLGDKAFDFVQVILRNRVRILKTRMGSGHNDRGPSFGAGVTIQTQEDKLLEKIIKKEKKINRGENQSSAPTNKNFDPNVLRQQREASFRSTPLNLNKLLPEGSTNTASFRATALPAGTTRTMFKTHEEVKVPYVKLPPIKQEELVPITAFDSFAQQAFPGITHLNRIQSKIFETAYKTNENLLICAPTGAGKTNVAMMTILHEVGQHFMGGILKKEEFKIVYVAPMKALASEMTENFSKRLAPLGVVVKELTGDMQLTKKELQETQIIVTTPEKWDVITRKSSDVALTSLVKLLIIDEVHLLHEDRGPVIEILVARTLRQVESTQSMIRIVGLSATLPNHQDVALFLRVSSSGLFYFDNSYRPVPLEQQYLGVKESNPLRSKEVMNQVCFDKVLESVAKGNQVMVFVHSRKDTFKTAEKLVQIAAEHKRSEDFIAEQNARYLWAAGQIGKSHNKDIKQLFQHGFSVHHAGMLRQDRNMVEKLFSEGLIKVLVCTATLAWGVNLPAHTVVIKGTQIYEPKRGNFIDLGILDVMQIFGRAGRPQFDTSGEGIIITTHDKLSHYLQLMNHQLPIESQFIAALSDHLNAEIVLGTVSNVKEAVEWLGYTYLYVRMLRNPMAYGVTYQEKEMDPLLDIRRRDLVGSAAKRLDECKMIRFDPVTEILSVTDLGRVASHFYIEHETIETFNGFLNPNLNEADVFNLVSKSHEFENIVMREEEMMELDNLKESSCMVEVKTSAESSKEGKVNTLLQAYITGTMLDASALVSDSHYIAQNAGRILRSLFEIVLKRGWGVLADRILSMCKSLDRRIWGFQHPLRQMGILPNDILNKLENKHMTIDRLVDMSDSEIGAIVNHPKMGSVIAKCVQNFPSLDMEVTIQPITRTVLRVQLIITPVFKWNDRFHGSVEPFWIWIEDSENEGVYHSEYFLLYKKQYLRIDEEPIKLTFTIPIFEPLPPQYYVHAISDKWLGAETIIPLSFKHLILPHQHPPHTELLDLQPLPVTTLKNKAFESLYRFSHFNPIQTQIFHTMYHTTHNVLLGSPTGSGKTISAELAILKVFRDTPNMKVVYIAPMKALVRERTLDWKEKFEKGLGKKVVELTGDYTPNVRAMQGADIITTTPEKWDGISRNWRSRGYVKTVALLVLDEIHLLGEERGPTLEVIVSRMRYISSHTHSPVRLVGLSTAMANARDLADWMGIENVGLFNFRPSVRPVPLEVHISGFPGKHYCPRMNSMNKTVYSSILTHSPNKPTLVFVSSRRQTRLTAIDLISYCAADSNPRQWLHIDERELDSILGKIHDQNLMHTLPFGIGMHHAGLSDGDREIVERLFGDNQIQILISTSTLAWGVNLPAHLVVIKGTEFFDPKTRRYVDMPITDVLQMMGRAGRPQFDTQGKAVILVAEEKKNFYKKFLYEPFPVESSLKHNLQNHFNAEIVSGSVSSKQDAVDYLTWTFFFRRLLMNPSYYDLEDTSFESINKYLSETVDEVLADLENAKCIEIEDGDELVPLTLGRIASYYYLNFRTVELFHSRIDGSCDVPALLRILCDASEYDELPVRHNEDKLNEELARELPWAVDSRRMDDPHTKTNLLLQAHFSHVSLPISDYITDTKSVLDQAVRVLQAMVDVSADQGWLFTTLKIMNLLQMIVQGCWHTDSNLLTLPNFTHNIVNLLYKNLGIDSLPELIAADNNKVGMILSDLLNKKEIQETYKVLSSLPMMDVKWTVTETKSNEESTLKVELHRTNRGLPKGQAYAPLFPKQKDEGWWVVLGEPQTNTLLALRRIAFTTPTTSLTLTFDAPEVTQEKRVTMDLYLISDSYLGLDQQYTIDYTVTP